jgi:Flp pilus assembly pilin Flp
MDRKEVAVVVGLVSFVALVPVVFVGGGQVKTILSNVGSAVTTTADQGEPDPAPAGTPKPAPTGGSVANAAGTLPELLIIRTGVLELEVTDLPAALAGARDRVVSLGGYLSESEEASEGGGARAMVVYRIPADRWEAALEGLRGLASRVRLQRTESEEVTGQVVDLGARIANLRASESAFQAIMARATKTPDVLDVQARLGEVRGEIEQLVAQKEHLEELAAYGTLTVAYSLPAPAAVAKVQAGWDPARDVDEATGMLIRAVQKATTAAIWIAIVWLPIGLVGGIGLAVGWWLVRIMRRRFASAQV